jgi:ferritin
MIKPTKLSKEVIDLLLPRLKDEFNAAFLYRSASNWCKNVGYFKASEFYAKESEDELTHAKKIEDFLTQWNVIPEIPTVPQPKLLFNGLADTIDNAYKIELKLYEEYEDTSAKIFKIGDLCVFDFLQQFRTIQTQSVAEYSDKINMLDGCDTTDKFQMLLLEKKLF